MIVSLNQVSIQLNDDSLIVSAAYMFLKWKNLNGNVKGLSNLAKAFSHITNAMCRLKYEQIFHEHFFWGKVRVL